MSLYSEGDRVLALFPLAGDPIDNRERWHWLPAVVLNVTRDNRFGTEYALQIQDERLAETDHNDETTYPIAFRDASEVQPVERPEED